MERLRKCKRDSKKKHFF